MRKFFVGVVAIAMTVLVTKTSEAQMQVFVAPGQVGKGEDLLAQQKGLYRWLYNDTTMVLGNPATKVWNLDDHTVIGVTPMGAQHAVLAFDPTTGGATQLPAGQGLWLPGTTGAVSAFEAPKSFWWSMAKTAEDLKKSKAPKASKEVLDRLKALEGKLEGVDKGDLEKLKKALPPAEEEKKD